jgi:hypothetical protein
VGEAPQTANILPKNKRPKEKSRQKISTLPRPAPPQKYPVDGISSGPMDCLSLWNPLSPDLPENFLISMGRVRPPKVPLTAFLQTGKFMKNPYFEPKRVEIMTPGLYNEMFFIPFRKGGRELHTRAFRLPNLRRSRSRGDFLAQGAFP